MSKLFLTDHVKNQICQLRYDAFSIQHGPSAAADAAKWNYHDDDSFHFGTMEENRLASTPTLISVARLTRVASDSRFELMLQFSSSDPFSVMPCYVLSRLATAPDKSGNGHSMKLRGEVFRFLVNLGQPHEYLYGTTLADSKRLQFLSNLGYELLIHEGAWKGYLTSADRKPVIYRIPIGRMREAISVIDHT